MKNFISYINNFTTYPVVKMLISCTKSEICAYFRIFFGIGPIVQHPSSIMTMNAPLARVSLPNAKLTVSILAKSLIV